MWRESQDIIKLEGKKKNSIVKVWKKGTDYFVRVEQDNMPVKKADTTPEGTSNGIGNIMENIRQYAKRSGERSRVLTRIVQRQSLS